MALAVTSALCLALGTQTQAAAVTDHTSGAMRLSTVVHLLSKPQWVVGLALLALGTGLNVAALSLATVTVVQPIGVIALVITTLLHARHRNLTINKRTWGAVLLCSLGGAAFVSAAVVGTDPTRVAPQGAESLVVGMLVGLVIILGLAELYVRHHRTSMFYVLGAGVLYGFVAVLVRLTMIQLLAHGVEGVRWLSVIMIVVAAVLGGWMVQSAFSCGPPDLVIAGLTVVDPMIGVVIGMTILGEAGANFTGLIASIMVLAGAIAIVGVVLLSRYHPDVLARKARAREGWEFPQISQL